MELSCFCLLTCPPKPGKVFKLGGIIFAGGGGYEQEATYDGTYYWFTSGGGCKGCE
jgi:hypothetical protein